jgi:hypothetical protein
MQLTLGKVGPVSVQVAIAILALLLVAFAPPAYGRMLLVPLDGAPLKGAAIRGLQATPLTAGPLPGSLIVEGDRRLLSGLWSEGVLVLAAPTVICASQTSGGNV